LDDLVALGLRSVGGGAGRNDVEQDARQFGVGDVGSDACTHGARAEDGNLTDLVWHG
jgi:hypothetical protein